jgi:hypothetical protein
MAAGNDGFFGGNAVPFFFQNPNFTNLPDSCDTRPVPALYNPLCKFLQTPEEPYLCASFLRAAAEFDGVVFHFFPAVKRNSADPPGPKHKITCKSTSYTNLSQRPKC